MLGDKIKHLRTTAKLTQEAFAEKLGVSQQAIGLWERNKNLPNQKLLIKIAKFFNVTLDYLFDENFKTNKILFTPDEVQLIEKFRLLNLSNQKNILKNIEFLIDQQNKQSFDYINSTTKDSLHKLILKTYDEEKARKTIDFIKNAVQYGIKNEIVTTENIKNMCNILTIFITEETDNFYEDYINKHPSNKLYENLFTAINRNIKEKKLKTG